jgi:hypothetical protein
MGDGIQVEITNRGAFDAALAEMRAEVKDPRLALAAAAKELATRAGAAAPHASGRLAGSHRATPTGEGNRYRITVDTPYAAVQHWGWPGHDIKRKPWLVATWLRDSGPLTKAAEAVQAGIDKAAART